MNQFNNWKSRYDMKYWLNQLNFAFYCSTFECGVSLLDNNVNSMLPPLALSFFMFHIFI